MQTRRAHKPTSPGRQAESQKPGDEYGTLVLQDTNAPGGVFPTPSAALPEGLRGEILKITGGDDEATGQLRLILGS